MGGRRVSHIERIFGRVDRLFPAFKQPVAQHSFDQCARDLGQFQLIAALATVRARVCSSKRMRCSFSPSSAVALAARFPGNDVVRFSFAAAHQFANFQQSALLQSLQFLERKTQFAREDASRITPFFSSSLRRNSACGVERSVSGFATRRKSAASKRPASVKTTSRRAANSVTGREHATKHFADRRQIIVRRSIAPVR